MGEEDGIVRMRMGTRMQFGEKQYLEKKDIRLSEGRMYLNS